MDIEKIMRRVNELDAWKKRVEPLLDALLADYQQHLADRAAHEAQRQTFQPQQAEIDAPPPGGGEPPNPTE